MSYFHKVIIVILSVATLFISSVGALAADTSNLYPINDAGQMNGIQPISIQPDTENQSYFNSSFGTVKEIQPFIDIDGNTVEGWQYVLTKNEKGA